MNRVISAIILSSGWRRLGIAMLAGAVAALAMPPLHMLPALVVSFPVAIWLLDGAAEGARRFSGASLRTAAVIGWAFGFGYFLAGLWWIGAAFFVETDEFLWLMPFGVLGLPAGLALFHAFGFALARLFWSPGALRVFAFAAAMTAAEWLRGTILTGFPWNAFGQAFAGWEWTAQTASIVGLDGLTLLALVIFASPAVLVPARGHGRMLLPAAALAGLAAMAVFGAWRLGTAAEATVPGVKLRIVQPNISQRDRIKPGAGREVLQLYLRLSDRATAPGRSGLADVTHLIWPESAFPFVLSREPQALAQLAAALPRSVTLMTGAVRTESPAPGERQPRYFNSLHVIGEGGQILDTYDKVHLVPFGEYLPGNGVLESLGLRKFVQEPGNFAAGLQHRLLDVAGLPPVEPLICYEAIFPHEVADSRARPGVLVNVTNDAWFGETFGPYQHFEQARLRAIELGLPLVRAANTGISAVIDPYGRALGRTTLGAQAVLDSALPVALPPTPFARQGGMIFAVLLGIAAILALTGRVRS